ncbi:hypothetical protein BDF14DRAFT_1879311 [Spinellus fusiger]|nr:hypothetical protein BDF14DRAFT_1879311 [Spinellus fusiger]
MYTQVQPQIHSTGMLSPLPSVPNATFDIKPLNLQGGQCTWCGKYGHKRMSCPLLK